MALGPCAAPSPHVFDLPVIQRCQLRNVTGRLPDELACTVAKRMRNAYHNPDPPLAPRPRGVPGGAV